MLGWHSASRADPGRHGGRGRRPFRLNKLADHDQGWRPAAAARRAPSLANRLPAGPGLIAAAAGTSCGSASRREGRRSAAGSIRSLLPLATTTGMCRAVGRWSSAWSGVHQVLTASYCASRVTQVVAVSGPGSGRHALECFLARLSAAADSVKNTPGILLGSSAVCGGAGDLRRRAVHARRACAGGRYRSPTIDPVRGAC
jgi:hypothetical protein